MLREMKQITAMVQDRHVCVHGLCVEDGALETL